MKTQVSIYEKNGTEQKVKNKTANRFPVTVFFIICAENRQYCLQQSADQ